MENDKTISAKDKLIEFIHNLTKEECDVIILFLQNDL